jgi:hypothetical protein
MTERETKHPEPNSPSATICAVKDQVTCELSGEAVILHLKDSIYYGLDPVGASIWKLLQTPKTIPEIRDAIMEEYDVDAERCEADLRALLKELAAKKLVVVGGE